jgi:hypothetical protein
MSESIKTALTDAGLFSALAPEDKETPVLPPISALILRLKGRVLR